MICFCSILATKTSNPASSMISTPKNPQAPKLYMGLVVLPKFERLRVESTLHSMRPFTTWNVSLLFFSSLLCSSTVLPLTRETFPFLPWNNSALTLAPQGLTFYPKLIFKEFLPPWMVPFLKRLPVNTVFSTLLHMYLDYLAPFSPLCCGRQFFSLEIYQIKWACGPFWWLLLRSIVWISSSLHNPLWQDFIPSLQLVKRML